MLLLYRTAVTVICITFGAGCAEYTYIRSTPVEAAVYVNGEFAGVTPFRFVVPRSKFSDDMRYRVEADGYQTREGELQTTIGRARIVGALFTLGLSLPFKRPRVFTPYQDLALLPVPRPPQPAASAARPLPAADPSVAGRLQQVEDLYGRGLIGDQERRRLRSKILDEL